MEKKTEIKNFMLTFKDKENEEVKNGEMGYIEITNKEEPVSIKLRCLYTTYNMTCEHELTISIAVGHYKKENEINWLEKLTGEVSTELFGKDSIVFENKRIDTINLRIPEVILPPYIKQGTYVIWGCLTCKDTNKKVVDKSVSFDYFKIKN